MDPTYTFQTFNDPADQPPPSGFNGFTNLMGINNFGLIAGFYGSGAMGDPNQGFLLTPNHSTFIPEDFPGVPQTQLTGLNDTGVEVGYFYKTNLGTTIDDQFGFYLQGGVFHEVNNPNTPTSAPGVMGQPQIENQLMGVNDFNIAVGFYNDASGNSHGYTYNINTKTFSADIIDPNAVSTVSAAINNLGKIAGFYTNSGGTVHGFLDNNGHFTTVDAPGASETQLLGINDFGIAVGFDVVNGVQHGIVFNSNTGKFTTLDPHGSSSTTLNGVNDLGQIVGFYTDSHGNTDGLLANPNLIGIAGVGHMMHV